MHVGICGEEKEMTEQEMKFAAMEYGTSVLPIGDVDGEGTFVDEYYPSQLRDIAELGFTAGANWMREKMQAKLNIATEALEQIAQPHGFTNNDFPDDMRACMEEDAELSRDALERLNEK